MDDCMTQDVTGKVHSRGLLTDVLTSQRMRLQKGGGVAAATTRTSRRVRGAAPASSGLTDDFREPSDGAHTRTADAT